MRKLFKYEVWCVNIIISELNGLRINKKQKPHASTGEECDLRILINIYVIMECKNGRAMVKYGNRQPIYKSNTFCLIKADDYRSKNTAICHVQLSVRSKNHEMGEAILSHTLIAKNYISRCNITMRLVFSVSKAFWI